MMSFQTVLDGRHVMMNRYGCAWIEAPHPEGYWSPGTTGLPDWSRPVNPVERQVVEEQALANGATVRYLRTSNVWPEVLWTFPKRSDA